MPGLLQLIIYLVVIGALAWLAIWILQQFPAPEPLGRVLYVAVVVIAVVAAIYAVSRAFGIAV
jgi:hypothetical protein